ncbi:MAG: hypothetical protein JWN48_954 [Myxococcaceae bacterium]|nr:hypothetical protein [Myxococcaceae bacterium]
MTAHKPLSPLHRDGLVGVVIAGAAARGPYEAGILAELIPRVFADKPLSEAVFLGTSSGAINASLWSYFADGVRSLEAVGDEVCKFWLQFDQPKVFRFPLTLIPRLGKFTQVLDTSPLRENALKLLRLKDARTPLSKGVLGTVGAVATACPDDGSGGRSVVFFQGNATLTAPPPGGSVDYVPTPVTLEHALASAAIPVVFPAVEITEPAARRGFYTDGGVRMNTPIQAARALGAQHIVVVSSHPTTYPREPRIATTQPDVVDLAAQSLHVVLADGMIEELRTIRQRNADARTDGAQNYSPIELIEASSKPGQLAQLAQHIVREWGSGLRSMRIRLTYRLFRTALTGLGTGLGNEELLSYVFFDADFAKEQIALGRAEGVRAAKAGWSL